MFDCNSGDRKETMTVVENSGLDTGSSETRSGKRVNANLFACNVENHVVCYDMRDSCSRPVHTIKDAHSAPILSLDVNPNKPYAICTAGEDCNIRFWDIRKPGQFLLNLEEDSHWVNSAKYNRFHD